MTDSDKTKTIDGFAYWIENEENGVCYIPLNLCEKIMKLLKEQKATQKNWYNLQELWKRARSGETLNETELNFLLADWDERNIFKQQEAIDEMVKPTKCPCGELFDAKDSSFCPRCGCAYGELSGRYTNIGR
jgi:hypothetical protein